MNKIFLPEQRIQELAKQLMAKSVQGDLSQIEAILRATATESIAAYREWLTSDSGVS